MNVNKVIYKPVGMLVGVLGGVAATAAFGKLWEMVTGERDAPNATDRHRSWREVLIAATVQGAVFGLVKTAIERGGAAGYSKVTGEWPDD